MQQSVPLTRRDFARLGALGLAFQAGSPRGWAASGGSLQHLLICFSTDPRRLALALPPPLKASPGGELRMEYTRLEIPDSERTVLVPGPLTECRLLAAVEHDGHSRRLLLARWTSHDASRVQGREFLDENVHHAAVSFAKDGSVVRASLRRHGILVHSIETKLTDQGASAIDWASYLVYRYRLHPDPSQGPLDLNGIELRLVGSDEVSTDASAANAFRRCDLTATNFRWPEASPFDPYIEFPVTDLSEVLYQEEGSAAAPHLAGNRRSVFVSKVDKQASEPFALRNYERPVSSGDPWRPAGWRETTSAFPLQTAEIEKYRSRSEIRLTSFDLIDIRVAVSAEALRPALPAECKISARPSLRIFGLRVESSDVAPEPFFETWLLAQCVVGDEQGWYALSHITTATGDVTLGRETFGHPSKIGEVDAPISPNEFSLQGRRLGREFLYAEGSVRSLSSGTSLSEIPVIALRPGPFPADGPVPGDLMFQTWYYQGQSNFVDRGSLLVDFPEKAVPGLEARPDPWFEFKPFQVLSATVMIHGAMQRGPGKVIATVADAAPYCLERCDGLLPGRAISSAVPPTFRPKQPLLQSNAMPDSALL